MGISNTNFPVLGAYAPKNRLYFLFSNVLGKKWWNLGKKKPYSLVIAKKKPILTWDI